MNDISAESPQSIPKYSSKERLKNVTSGKNNRDLSEEKSLPVNYKVSKSWNEKQFINKLFNYQAKTKVNIELVKAKVKKEEVKECTFAPQLTARSKASRSFNKFLADQSNFLKKKKSLADRTEVTINRIPKINANSAILASKKYRDTSLHNHLYTHQRDVEQVKEVLRSKADTIMLQGFNKEFQRALDEVDLNYSSIINFNEMLLILEKLRLIKDPTNNSRAVNELVSKLWSEIKSPKEDTAPIGMLRYYVAAALKLESVEDSKSARIAREYAALYWNRQSNKQQKKTSCEYSFKPILCKESLLIVEELKKKGTQSSKNLDKQDKEMFKECTFKPKINEYKKVKRAKSINLYQRHNSLNRLGYKIVRDASPKMPFTIEELEHPKSQQKATKRTNNIGDSELSYRVKDIIRQKSAIGTISRKEVLSENKFSPLNIRTESISDDSLSDKKEQEILLYIDVNLKGSKQRIVVYKGDTAQKVAEQFTLKNSTTYP
jgi:hypothetical protein